MILQMIEPILTSDAFVFRLTFLEFVGWNTEVSKFPYRVFRTVEIVTELTQEEYNRSIEQLHNWQEWAALDARGYCNDKGTA